MLKYDIVKQISLNCFFLKQQIILFQEAKSLIQNISVKYAGPLSFCLDSALVNCPNRCFEFSVSTECTTINMRVIMNLRSWESFHYVLDTILRALTHSRSTYLNSAFQNFMF